MKRNSVIAFLVIVTLSVFFLARLSNQNSQGPLIDGERLGVCIQNYDADELHRQVAEKAVCEIGTNAIPFLLRSYEMYDSLWKRWFFSAVAPRRFGRAHFRLLQDRQRQAGMAFRSLALCDAGAVPSLIAVYNNAAVDSEHTRSTVISILGVMGPAASNADAFLIQQTHSTNELLRVQSFQVLGMVHANPSMAVPALIVGLGDSNLSVRIAAANVLCSFGAEAKPAIQELLRMQEEERRKARGWPFSEEDRQAEYVVTATLNSISNALQAER